MVSAALIIIGFLSCSDRTQSGHKERGKTKVQGITVETVGVSKIDSFYETAGTVKAKNTAVISSRTLGAITSVNVKEGDMVRAGQLLFAVDDRDAMQRVNAAEAGYREATKALESAEQNARLGDVTSRRYMRLYEEKVITPQEFDQIETAKNVSRIERERASEAVSRAKALLEEARVHQGFTQIRAPFAGLVTAKKIERGNMAVPGAPLLILDDIAAFKIEAALDERLSGRIRPGMAIKVGIDGAAETTDGVITKVAPTVDPATRSFIIEAEIKGKHLKPGLYRKAFIPDGTRETLLVPTASIVEKGQLTGVYVVNQQGVISYRLIRKGKPYGSRIEVLSGLKSGDAVIVGGVEKAVDGGVAAQ